MGHAGLSSGEADELEVPVRPFVHRCQLLPNIDAPVDRCIASPTLWRYDLTVRGARSSPLQHQLWQFRDVQRSSQRSLR